MPAAFDPRQFQREARERRTEAQALRRDLQALGVDVKDLDAVIGALAALDSARVYTDADEITRLQPQLAADAAALPVQPAARARRGRRGPTAAVRIGRGAGGLQEADRGYDHQQDADEVDDKNKARAKHGPMLYPNVIGEKGFQALVDRVQVRRDERDVLRLQRLQREHHGARRDDDRLAGDGESSRSSCASAAGPAIKPAAVQP